MTYREKLIEVALHKDVIVTTPDENLVSDQLPHLGSLSASAVQARYPDALRTATEAEAEVALQQARATPSAASSWRAELSLDDRGAVRCSEPRGRPTLLYLQRPSRREPNFAVTSMNYYIRKLLDGAESCGG